MSTLNRQVAIIGVAEGNENGSIPKKTVFELMLEATHNVLEDAGIAKSDLDAIYSPSGAAVFMDYLAQPVASLDTTTAGGSSMATELIHAAAAISAGLCHTVLLVYAAKARSSGHADRVSSSPMGAGNLRGKAGGAPSLEDVYGLSAGAYPAAYAMLARRHMVQYGTTSEQFAEVAVSTRKWAAMNPRAVMRGPLTVQDVLSSPFVCEPLHRWDCCLVTDAAGAMIVTTPERARNAKQKPVYLLGAGEYHTHRYISSMVDFTQSGAGVAAGKALRMAEVTLADVDVLELYDCFTSEVVCALEDIGFCGKGEGGAFVQGGRTAPGGALPMNTHGGALSYTHNGYYGIFPIIEAVRQLRGDYKATPRQVQNVETALVYTNGGILMHQAAMVLGVK